MLTILLQNKNRVELHLFKLFYNQKVLDQLGGEMSLKEIEVEEMQTNKRESEKKLKNAKKVFGTASRELAELEAEIQVKVVHQLFFSIKK